jgi:hypothetical protein
VNGTRLTRLLFFFLLFRALMPLGAEVLEVPSTRVKGEARDFALNGKGSLETAEALVAAFQDGPYKVELLVFFDPKSGYFVSDLAPHVPLDSVGTTALNRYKATPWVVVFSSSGRMVFFGASNAIEYHFSTATARDIDEAFDKSLAELRATWPTSFQPEWRPPNTGSVTFLSRNDKLESFIEVHPPMAPIRPSIEMIKLTPKGYESTTNGASKGAVTVGMTDDGKGMKLVEPLHRVE